jgi:cysteine-S-conjugate beta-lyase
VRFDFDTLVDRTHSGNMKYIITPECIRSIGGITYSGAEMDFKTAPVIIEALTKKAQGGLYGYTCGDADYLGAVATWMAKQRDWQVELDWIVPAYGTIQSVAAAVRAFTAPGDGVIIQPPVYMQYRKCIELNDRVVVSNPLLYERGRYEMDLLGLERLMARRNTKLMVLCNPHNPIARVWDRHDLEHVAEMAGRHGVLVFSDEIFGEVVFPPHEARPFSTIGNAADISIVSTSLGKIFNFTGFSHANMVIPNEDIRRVFKRQRDVDHYGSLDPFVYSAAMAGYREGGEWAGEMVKYVWGNVQMIRAFFAERLPQVTIPEPQGTFVIWIDWRGLGLSEDALEDFLVNEAYLHLDRGSEYGMEGEGFTRMNVATPRAEIGKSLDRLLVAAEARGYAARTVAPHQPLPAPVEG